MSLNSVTPQAWRLYYPDGSTFDSEDSGSPPQDAVLAVIWYEETVPSSGNPYRQLVSLEDPSDQFVIGADKNVIESRHEGKSDAELPEAVTYRGGSPNTIEHRVSGKTQDGVSEDTFSSVSHQAMSDKTPPGSS